MRVSMFLALALCAWGTQPVAQGFEGGALAIEYYKYDEGDNIDTSFATALADASYLFGPKFGLQVGIAGSTQLDASQDFLDEDDIYALSLHGFYDLNDQTRLGLLVGADSYNDLDYIAALEAVFVTDAFRLEGRLGRYESDVEPATLIEAKGNVGVLGALDATVNFQRINYDDDLGYFELISLGASYAITDTVTGYGSYGATTNDFGDEGSFDGDQLTLGITVSVGGQTNDRLFNYNPFF